MKDQYPRVGMEVLCGLFGKSRNAWYKKQRSTYTQAIEEQIILECVRKVRRKMPRLGGRKLIVKLEQQQLKIGRDALFDILRRNELLVRRRRTRVFTTQSYHWLRKYPNLSKSVHVNRPNQLWVSDITYVESMQGHVYLFLITDAYSKMILGYEVSEDLGATNAVKALQMALQTLPYKTSTLIHHSDRGIQYCSDEYVKVLHKHQIQISMTQKGSPLENSIAERVNGILKDEWLYDIGPEDPGNLKKIISKIVKIYNNERPHLSIDMLTPEQASQMNGELKRKWKNYYKKGLAACPDV